MAKAPATTPLAAGMATVSAALPAADDDDDAALPVRVEPVDEVGVDESSKPDDDDVDLEAEADVELVGFCASQALQYDTFWFCTPLASVIFASVCRSARSRMAGAYQSWGRRCSIATGWWPPGRTIDVLSHMLCANWGEETNAFPVVAGAGVEARLVLVFAGV